MASKTTIAPAPVRHTMSNPAVHSYDSSYEYGLEHWNEVRHLVEEAEAEEEVLKDLADHGILIHA